MPTLTHEQIRTLAPDAAAARSGEALADRRRWDSAGRSDVAAWGLCKGSGANPYQVAVDIAGPGYKCSCPSRKIPCKHALGLLFHKGAPSFDHELAGKLAALGAPAFACTPDHFPGLMAAAIEKRDVGRWAAEQGIALERPKDS